MGILSLIFGAIALYGVLMISGFHKVRQGYIGLYKNFGVLKSGLSQPGIHFRIPFYQEFIEMKVSIQTDVVEHIPCGTSNGTLVHFDKVEVVNKLRKEYVYDTVLNYTEDYEKFWITDKIHHEINQFCSKHSLQEIYIDIFDKLDEQLIKALNRDIAEWAPGIQILSLRITKPIIPSTISANFQAMQKTKVSYFIAVQKEKTRIEQEQTIQRQEIIKAESRYDVKLIEFEKAIQHKENEKKMAAIEAEVLFEKTKTEIKAQFMAALQEAELYPALYSDAYLSFLASDAFSSNVTLNVGKHIPNVNIGKTF